MSTDNLMTAGQDQQWRVFAVIKNIPAGSWMSYGDVAKNAGLPGYHRYVVRVLRLAPEGALPWFRVLRSDGRSGMPEGSQAYQEQWQRLAREGITQKNGKAASGRLRAL